MKVAICDDDASELEKVKETMFAFINSKQAEAENDLFVTTVILNISSL